MENLARGLLLGRRQMSSIIGALRIAEGVTTLALSLNVPFLLFVCSEVLATSSSIVCDSMIRAFENRYRCFEQHPRSSSPPPRNIFALSHLLGPTLVLLNRTEQRTARMYVYTYVHTKKQQLAVLQLADLACPLSAVR